MNFSNILLRHLLDNTLGAKEGTLKSYRCNGEIIRPYSEITKIITIRKETDLTSLGTFKSILLF